MPMMKTVVALSWPPCHAISVLVMTWSQNFGSRGKVSPLERNRLVSSSDLICSNISSPGGGCELSEVLLGWRRCWILIPSLFTFWTIHSGSGPMVLALRDSFLKASLEKEARVDDLRWWGAPSWTPVRDGETVMWCHHVLACREWDNLAALEACSTQGERDGPPIRSLLFLCRNLPKLPSRAAIDDMCNRITSVWSVPRFDGSLFASASRFLASLSLDMLICISFSKRQTLTCIGPVLLL